MSSFLCGASDEKFKFSLVAWETVCFAIGTGGLGIRKIGSFSKVLLGKWLWWFQDEATQLWRWVLAMKYEEEWGGWTLQPVFCLGGWGVSRCNLWRSIRAGWDYFLQFVRSDLWASTWVRSWHTIWIGNSSLKESHLDLYACSFDKNTLVRWGGEELEHEIL